MEGLIAAPFTPMTAKGDILFSSVFPYADKLVASGVKGVFIGGTTGEGFSMTLEEREALTETWVKASAGRLKIIVHVGHNCQIDATAIARHAAASGADAIASIAPNFYKPCSVEDLVGFFEPIAAAAPSIPFYYYNMPSASGVSLPVDKILQVGAAIIPNFVGVKFTHNDMMEMRKCLALEDGRYEVLNGFDEALLGGLALGAVGAVGSTYNYAAKIYIKMMESFRAGKMEEARAFQDYSIEIVRILIKYGGGVRCGKAIMNLVGIPCGECRLPISKFTETEYSSLKADLDSIAFFEHIG